MTTAPYGAWSSPLTVEQLTSASVGLAAPRVDGGSLYWLESHADQGGRTGVWRVPLAGGEPTEVTPPTAYVRTRVHEYGGGAYAVADGVLVHAELSDGRLHRVTTDGEDVAITPSGLLRYADLRVHPERDLVLAVREDHRGVGPDGEREPVNTVVALSLTGPNADGGTVLCSGADFYASPELGPDGRLAWVQWDHPAMPWDATLLSVARLAGDRGPGWRLDEPVRVAGGGEESVLHPRWLPDGSLVFLSDRTDWWNPYRWRPGAEPEPLCPTEAEFCPPLWQLGGSPYAVVDARRLVCCLNRRGRESVELLDLDTGALAPLTAEGTGSSEVAVGDGRVAALLEHQDRPVALALLALADAAGDQRAWVEVRPSSSLEPEPDAVSRAQAVTWTGPAGEVHGWYYPPVNPQFRAPEGTLPPLITLSHGGPTAASSSALSLGLQFWTSRGYAILDVNYSGSTGYGRAYRDRLRGRWGVLDVADCADGALALGAEGLADPARLVVKGGSAGGYTTLRALTATDTFAAGISSYGIGDLEALARHTHKFEAHYTDGLVGPYPEARETYLERSPITHVDALSAPILLLQGSEDKVVPPEQAEEMAAAARRKGLPVALLLFEGEGHGFRRAETIKAAYDAQQYFLGRLFGFEPADDVPPIPIENLD